MNTVQQYAYAVMENVGDRSCILLLPTVINRF
jgi:hypothetical protein